MRVILLALGAVEQLQRPTHLIIMAGNREAEVAAVGMMAEVVVEIEVERGLLWLLLRLGLLMKRSSVVVDMMGAIVIEAEVVVVEEEDTTTEDKVYLVDLERGERRLVCLVVPGHPDIDG